MVRRITDLVIIAALLLLVFPHVEAQPATTHSSFRFWAYRTGDANWSDIRFESKPGDTETLSLGKFMKGRTHEYQGPRLLTFFRETSAAVTQGSSKWVRKPIASIRIPSGAKEAILIFTPVTDTAGVEFSITIIETDQKEYPPNSLRILNQTGTRLAGKVGASSQYFNAGISKAFDFSNYHSNGIPVAFMIETEEGPKFVFEKRLDYALNRRAILLLQPPKRKGSYKLQVTNLIEQVE